MEGHNIYTPLVLRFYDFFVLGLSNRFLWKCPTKEIVALYNRNISDQHLDIGVGTGYYLTVARFKKINPQITLVDLNKNSLSMASKRIEYLKPTQIVANILDDLPLKKKYSSVSLCYLLHCLPGGINTKSAIFDRVSKVVVDGGRVFGATIIPDIKETNIATYFFLNLYNKLGIFSNLDDTIEGLKIEFQRRFIDSRIQRIGSVVLFEGILRK